MTKCVFSFSRKLSTESILHQILNQLKAILNRSGNGAESGNLSYSILVVLQFDSIAPQFICTRGSGCDTSLLVSSIKSIEGLSVWAKGVHVTDLS